MPNGNLSALVFFKCTALQMRILFLYEKYGVIA